MATLLISSKIAGESLVVDTTGITYTREYHVNNLSGADIMFDAMQVVPAYGAPHPTQPNLFVNKIEPKPFLDSRTEAKVYVTWRPPDFSNVNSPIVEFSGITNEVLTEVDRDGNQITVIYTPTGGSPFKKQPGRCRAREASGLLSVDMKVYTDPSLFLTYLNKVNSTNFRGQPKWTWLVCEVGIRKLTYSDGWMLHYAILYREFTHLQTVTYPLPNGRPPADIGTIDRTSVGQKNGYTNVLTYNEADLNNLNIPTGFGG